MSDYKYRIGSPVVPSVLRIKSTGAVIVSLGALSPEGRRRVNEALELMNQPSKVPTSEEEIEARFKARQAKPHFDFHTYSDGLG